MSQTTKPTELKFVQEYMKNGFDAKHAYMVAYECENENSAAVQGCNLLKKEKIKKMIEEEEGSFRDLARQFRADKTAIVKKLAELIFDKEKWTNAAGKVIERERDGKTVIQAISTLAKLTGDFAPEKKEVKIDDEGSKIDTTNMTPEQLEEAKKSIMADL